MNCYKHPENGAVGTCVNCGKFICEECNTEIKGKNYCKSCVSEVFDELQKKSEQPVAPASPTAVYMNSAGGGGGGSSSSSSSSSSAASSGGWRGMRYRQSCLLHIILFFCTAGIGNIIYYLWARNRYYD